MTYLNLFTVILFFSVLSNSAFAIDEIDPIDYEITMGKIDAAELATTTEKSKELIEYARKVQEELGTNSIDSSGKFSALGQMITILELSIQNADPKDTQEIMKLNQELADLLKQ